MNDVDKIKLLISKIGTEGYKDGSSTKSGWMYHSIPFEEFDTNIHKESSSIEYDIILKDYGDFKNKKILDIGCANGHFSFNYSLLGADQVTGYEADKLVCDVNEEIVKFKKLSNIKFINKHFNIDDAESFEDEEFDVIIMLNIHMWIHKQTGADKTRKLMECLARKCNTMYFQTAHQGGGGGYQVPEFTKPSHIKKYLQGAGFKNIQMLNQNMDWFKRYMFKCTHV